MAAKQKAKEVAVKNVVVLIGAGQIAQAIARRVGARKHVVLADARPENAGAAAELFSNAGFDVTTATVDVSSRQAVETLVESAASLGELTALIHAAGISPSQASPTTIPKVDLYGTALVLHAFGKVIAKGGSGVVIASQSGHRLPPLTAEENKALATERAVLAIGCLPYLRRQPTQPVPRLTSIKESPHEDQTHRRAAITKRA